MQDVEFEDNVLEGEPAGDQTVAVAPGPNGTEVFSRPVRQVFQWPDGPFTATQNVTEGFLSGTVAPVEDQWRTRLAVRALPPVQSLVPCCPSRIPVR